MKGVYSHVWLNQNIGAYSNIARGLHVLIMKMILFVEKACWLDHANFRGFRVNTDIIDECLGEFAKSGGSFWLTQWGLVV